MPAKNTVRQFEENCYYHVYNRGVEKRTIFIDKQDYSRFMYLLKKYFDSNLGANPSSLSIEVKLLAFCLMPNHFHLQIKQITQDGITKLMRKLTASYVNYFNNKYKRQGSLFQGKYKAAIIKDDAYFLHVNRYIHLNPTRSDPKSYPYSSLKCYLGVQNLTWVSKEEILNFFKPNLMGPFVDHNSYEAFIDDYRPESKEFLGVKEGSDPNLRNFLEGSDPRL